MSYDFETERLGFRPWKESDLAPFSRMNKDPEVMQFFVNNLATEESKALIDRITRHFEARNYGLWAVDFKGTGEFAGFIGLNYTDFKSDFTPCVEIGWRLAREYWNQGLATEGAKECLKKGFGEYGLKKIFSFTSTSNIRSINVMKKIGMSLDREFEHPKISIDNPLCRHVLYKIESPFQ